MAKSSCASAQSPALTLADEAPLAALCALVAYAIDAERVLSSLSFNAGVIPELEVLMSQACDTWRNPNCDGQLASNLVDVQGFIAEHVAALLAGVRDCCSEG